MLKSSHHVVASRFRHFSSTELTKSKTFYSNYCVGKSYKCRNTHIIGRLVDEDGNLIVYPLIYYNTFMKPYCIRKVSMSGSKLSGVFTFYDEMEIICLFYIYFAYEKRSE